ncbi:hypothetical protein BX616_003725 [Lobosporangium transversale]|nr:hypothetical protein BX616_003725 [Lobosporangium transversale]
MLRIASIWSTVLVAQMSGEIDQLSPLLSPAALQFWYKNKDSFDSSFYEARYTGLAFWAFKCLAHVMGVEKAVE